MEHQSLKKEIDLIHGGILKQVDELAVLRAHLLWIGHFEAARNFKGILEELGILRELLDGHELFALLVVTGNLWRRVRGFKSEEVKKSLRTKRPQMTERISRN